MSASSSGRVAPAPPALAPPPLERRLADRELVAQRDQVCPLVAEPFAHRVQLGDQRVRLVEVVEAGHTGIVPATAPDRARGHRGLPVLAAGAGARGPVAARAPGRQRPGGGYDCRMRLASRMRTIGTETAFEAAARARALEATGRSVIHLEIGEPDFDTPENIRAAAQKALDDGFTHYGPFFGLPALREAIAADATARKGFPVSAESVVVVPGAKPIMFYAMLALIEPGDEVVYPDPGFPIYESMARYAGGTTKPYAIRQANDFRVDLDELASLLTPRTKLLVLNSPANPTGGVLTRADMDRIAELVAAHPGLASSPTRSTAASSTTASRSRWARIPGWPNGRSPSTGSPRPTR